MKLTHTELDAPWWGHTVPDDKQLSVGTGGTAYFSYITDDANANCLGLIFPEALSPDVPVFFVGDGTADRDLGFFNGMTEPLISVIDSDADCWAGISFVADDRPALRSLAGTYWTIGSAATASSHSLADESDLFIQGKLEIDSVTYHDQSVYMPDNLDQVWGTGNDVAFSFRTQDADANCFVCRMPSAGSNVPIWVFGDPSIWSVDYGLFDGVSQPALTALDKEGRYTTSTTGTCDGSDLDELTETSKFGSAVVGDVVRILSGTNVTAGWYYIDDVTDANNVNLDRNFSSGASTDITYVAYHDFTMLSADGICTRIVDGAPGAGTVEPDRDGWIVLDVGQANGRLYWRANNAWHYVDATAGLSLPASERVDPKGKEFRVGTKVELVVDRINDDGSFHAMPYAK